MVNKENKLEDLKSFNFSNYICEKCREPIIVRTTIESNQIFVTPCKKCEQDCIIKIERINNMVKEQMNAKAYYNSGTDKARIREFKDVMADFDKVIELNPNYAMAYIGRGIVKDMIGNNKGAVEDYDKAIKLNPNYARAYLNRGIAKKEVGDYEGAIADFDKAIEFERRKEKVR